MNRCDKCYEYSCDCIHRSSLPKLPEGWSGPFCLFGWNDSYAVVCNKTAIIDELTEAEATFLVNLLNVTHPAPAGGN